MRRGRAVGDVLGYAQAQHDWETEQQAYHVLYSQVGAETASIAGMVMPVWWAMPVLGVGGAAAGHVTGRLVAAHRAAEIEATAPERLPSYPDVLPAGPGLMPSGPDVMAGDAKSAPSGDVETDPPDDETVSAWRH